MVGTSTTICEMALHLFDYSSEGHSTHIHPGWNTFYSQWWKSSALPSTLEPHLLTMMKELYSFHPGWNHILLTMMEELCSSTQARTTSCSQWWKTLIQDGTHPAHNDERFLHLHSSRWEHILLTMMKRLCTYIHLGGNTSCSQWWKGSALTSDLVGTNPIVTLEWPLVLLDGATR